MSSLADDIGGMLGSIFNMDNAIAAAKIAGLGYALSQLQPDDKPVNKKGTREQVDPDTTHHIPIVYGTTVTAGIVSDAVLSDDSMTMTYCLTICESTGRLYSTGDFSQIGIERVYWNENTINFKSDGITAASFSDANANTSTDIADLIQFYCYCGGSEAQYQVFPSGVNGTKKNAWEVMPKWTINHKMSDLCFCIVKVKYNSTKSVTGLGNVKFKVHNTLSKAGDVVYDYMTNTRYGCGIAEQEIYQV
jgi:hypothetical protein